MALKNITFNMGQGGLGTPLPGQDYISGYQIYSGTIPTSFTANVALPVYSVTDAESKGIVGDYSDETKAQGTYKITTLGSTGNKFTMTVVEPSYNGTTSTKTLVSYTKVAGDTTIALLGASITLAINNGNSGYTANFLTDTITITAKPGMGIALNTGTPIVVVIVGTIAGTLTQFTGGVASLKAVWHYQISEYFRVQSKGILYIQFSAVPSTYNFIEVNNLQVQASGKCRQIMVFSANGTSASLINADIDALETQSITMSGNYTPCSFVYSSNIIAITDLSTLPNLRTRTAEHCSMVIGQDGAGLGGWLSISTGLSVPQLGACLGAVSLSKVSECIGWVGKFNLSNGTENEVLAFSNTQTWATMYASYYNLLNQLDNYGYIFLTKKNNINGSYFNDSHTCISINSDYAYIERNRTIDKAVRNSYLELIPLANSPLLLNSDGTLSNSAIANFVDAEKPSMDQMVRDNEISAYAVIIDPTQNIQSTSTINITVKIVGVGVARNIVVNLSLNLSI